MFNAYGWIIVRSSREKYEGISSDEINTLDDETDNQDKIVWDTFEVFLNKFSKDYPLLKTNFTRHFNNVSGHLSILSSRNHSAPELYELIEWIVTNAKGSYGILYLNNDESDLSNEFRIIRINKSLCTEHSDPFLSPIYPVIEYENLQK